MDTLMNHQLKVLLIEDDINDVYFTIKHLKQHWENIIHLQVDSIDKLNEALQSEWDVILCDFNLIGFDGMTALRLVRLRNTKTPFIILSGEIKEEVASLMMQLGAKDYVEKDNLQRLVPIILRELQQQKKSTANTLSIQTQNTETKKKKKDADKFQMPIDVELNETISERHKAVINLLFVAEFIRRRQAANLEKHNLTLTRIHILRILLRALPERISIKTIKDEMIYKTIDLSRLIDKMYKEGLLDTNSNAKKKTGKEITITPKGLQILKEININDGGMFLQADYLSEKNAQSINEALQDTLLKIKGFFK